MKYKVYYAKTLPYFDVDDDYAFIPGITHCFIREIKANSFDEVFSKMQGFNWSPNGEANALIRAAGVSHTSMSIGDVAVDEQGHAWACASLGWKEIEPLKKRLLVLGCTARKRPDVYHLPAIERYDGPLVRVLRKAIREKAVNRRQLDIFFLSAKYGLIDADYSIPNYNQRMTVERAMELRDQVMWTLSEDTDGPYTEIYIDLGPDYLPALPGKGRGIDDEMELYKLFRFYSLRWGKGGIGQRCAALKRWLRCNCDHH